VRHTGEIGLFRLIHESGVAAGVRRIEALTGPGAYHFLREQEGRLGQAARILKTQPDNLTHRAEQILAQNAELESLLDELRSGGGGGETDVASEVVRVGGVSAPYRAVRLRSRGMDDARRWGDAFLASGRSGVAVVAAELPGGKLTLLAFVTDDLISRGVRADAVVREVAAVVGGRGGGKAHLAQAGVEAPERIDDALRSGTGVVRRLLEAGS
jgi:alanyl-tRNA synthetase